MTDAPCEVYFTKNQVTLCVCGYLKGSFHHNKRKHFTHHTCCYLQINKPLPCKYFLGGKKLYKKGIILNLTALFSYTLK